MKKHLDAANTVVIALTMILFIGALFIKGFTHDLLLEAGVLLVSIKLIMMNYKNAVSDQELSRQLNDIQKAIANIQKTQ